MQNTSNHPLNFVADLKDQDITRSDNRSLWLDYKLAEKYAGELPEQKAIVESSRQSKLPEIHVGPYEGHLLQILLTLMGAERGVEVGTLGGYSSSWICRAIKGRPKAHLDTLEFNPDFAKVAERNLKPWNELVTVHVGKALETMESKLADLTNLDFVFIDADKASYPDYFNWAWPRIRKGGVILIDNFYLWGGVYFAEQKSFPVDYVRMKKGETFTETQWQAMKGLWQTLQDLGGTAQKTILPTSEGLGIVLKL